PPPDQPFSAYRAPYSGAVHALHLPVADQTQRFPERFATGVILHSERPRRALRPAPLPVFLPAGSCRADTVQTPRSGSAASFSRSRTVPAPPAVHRCPASG